MRRRDVIALPLDTKGRRLQWGAWGMLIRFGIVVLLAINVFSAKPIFAAGDLHTAAGVMAGCRNFLAGNDTSLLIQGMCFGEVTALFETFAGKCAPPRCGGTAAYAHSRGVHRQPTPCAAERAVQSSGHRSNDEGLAVQAAMTFEVAA